MLDETSKNTGLDDASERVVIIGMAGRFPGARNVQELWANLKNGVESIHPFTPAELQACGVDEEILRATGFVNAGAVMPDADCFDAAFFGISSREAETMDPQHRVFLETAWEALESAGYDPESFPGSIGIFGGVAPNTYFQNNLAGHSDLLRSLGRYSIMLGNEREYAVTRVAFKLNLTGPCASVNTACSTSAVAIHLACQSLLSGECDIALAGGGRVHVPLTGGYMYDEGGILSPDGHCRAFSADARGTVIGSGVAMVVLRRLTDAIADRDCIFAVIKGSAINNDGSRKVGFTAPSVQGQASVIEEALRVADVDADTIGYVETHGTGTSLGDPIEIAALTKAYAPWTQRRQQCPIGSIKTNIGHLDAAAGVGGVIKTTMALRDRLIPPSLNFDEPNPQINFADSPFYVNVKLQNWATNGTSRRAGVSSFGLGGTNAHIVLEEAPETGPAAPSRSHQLLLLSARSQNALEHATRNLAEHLRRCPPDDLADIAYTLQTGRRRFNYRRMVVCRNSADAISALDPVDAQRVTTSRETVAGQEIAFMFSGQGSQYLNMGLGLYRSESVFKRQIDRCSEILRPYLSPDLVQLLYPDEQDETETEERLQQTVYTQPVLFSVEYALARQWMHWGIQPGAMIGHSVGEYVAACLAGVFTLEDALSLVATRGKLIQALPTGSMLAVPLSEREVTPYLSGGVDLAVASSPSLCVLSGHRQAISDVERQLSARGVESRAVRTSHAFHSSMMDPVLQTFEEAANKIRFGAPQIPFVSNVTGTWITPEEATSPAYWVKHVRNTVRLSDGLQQLLARPNIVFLEVGPGRTLSTVVKQQPAKADAHLVLASTRHPNEIVPDLEFMLNTLGRLWLAGVPVDWSRFYAAEKRSRKPLPTYPFERKRYWISPPKLEKADARTGVHSALELRSEEQTAEVSLSREGDHMQADAPRSEAEHVLVNIWRDLLGVSSLSIKDNFFDLGGSSLLATRLFTQIASRVGIKLPIATIFEAPTIEQLAKALEPGGAAASHSSLVLIQSGRSRPPFYCLPGNLGNVFLDFGYLKRHLGSDQPFYGLQDGLGHPSQVEALAAHYVEEIRHVQAEGPYFLGGVCSGGVVAFEMAQQFSRQGQPVAFLALIEPASLPLPGARSYLDLAFEIYRRFIQHVGQHSRNVSSLAAAEQWTYLRLRFKLIANLWSLKHYGPQKYPGGFYLFLTRESISQSPRLGWQQFATGGVELCEIPGTHRSITGDYAKIESAHMEVLGRELRGGIDRAIGIL